jgi:hypothetical protein
MMCPPNTKTWPSRKNVPVIESGVTKVLLHRGDNDDSCLAIPVLANGGRSSELCPDDTPLSATFCYRYFI